MATNREEGGRIVRLAWIKWAEQQPDPKPFWLVTWEELNEPDKEADRQIWEAIVAPYQDVVSAARAYLVNSTPVNAVVLRAALDRVKGEQE